MEAQSPSQIDVLSEHAEAGVRIGDIARETGTSTSSIYHFFTNREELIAGAEVERYSRSLIAFANRTEAQMAGVTSKEVFRDSCSPRTVEPTRPITHRCALHASTTSDRRLADRFSWRSSPTSKRTSWSATPRCSESPRSAAGFERTSTCLR